MDDQDNQNLEGGNEKDVSRDNPHRDLIEDADPA